MFALALAPHQLLAGGEVEQSCVEDCCEIMTLRGSVRRSYSRVMMIMVIMTVIIM